jgi:hypothetical protein
MTGIDGGALWRRRDEFVRDGIPLDVYRRQVALAHRLRRDAYGRWFKAMVLAARSALKRAAHWPAPATHP